MICTQMVEPFHNRHLNPLKLHLGAPQPFLCVVGRVLLDYSNEYTLLMVPVLRTEVQVTQSQGCFETKSFCCRSHIKVHDQKGPQFLPHPLALKLQLTIGVYCLCTFLFIHIIMYKHNMFLVSVFLCESGIILCITSLFFFPEQQMKVFLLHHYICSFNILFFFFSQFLILYWGIAN